ncbi:MAG: hypothetical protein ACKOXG_10850 [Arenimonas sp.]
MPNHDIRAAADQSATGRNTINMPTPGQLAAGNYRKGRVSIHGLPIAIENPIGTFREGVGADGKPWRTRIAADYGYFAGTRGADGDGVDVFVGDFHASGDVWVINQVDPSTGAFDEHKVMLGFGSEALARAAYTESYDRDWKGLGSMVRITVPQLRWWLKRGSMLSPLEDAGSLPAMPASGSTLQPVRWSADAEPVGKSLGRVLYEMQLDDVGDDLLTDPMTMADLMTDPDITSHMVFDALVSEVGMLQHRAEQLMSVMQAAGRTVKPQQLEVGEPVRLRGTMQVPVIYGMSDGQTLSIWFHNPDTTPNKLTPMDTLVSARWVINKKDVTIAVAPEKGQDLKPREVARRIMALIEKNSAAFARANAKAAETAQKIDGLKAEIVAMQAELVSVNEKIAQAEAVRVDRAAKAKAVPVDPTKEAKQQPSADPGTIVTTFPLPARIASRVTQAIESLNDAKGQLETARTGLDENPKIGGGGRYESEVWQKVQGRVSKANDDLQKLRELGNQNGQIASLEALINSLGGVPDVKPSAKALAWAASPAPVAAPAPASEPPAAAPAQIEQPASAPAAEPPATDLFGDAKLEALTPEGAASKVKTAKGTEVLTGYTVVEADSLITSHNPATGDANPAFPAELQPRDRGRDASIAWVRKTAQDLDPDLLGKSRRADSGAPIVGPDGVVESGNGRTMAVVLAYQTGKADDYRAWLEEEAGYFGLKPGKVKAMRRPVLVRIRTSEVDRVAFAVEANQDDKLAMTATEVAKADAGRLTDDVVALMTEDGDLTTATNVPFLAAFMRTLGDAEAARYSTSDGKPTASLIARVQAAIFAKAYADDRLLELTADVAKPEIANIVKALNHAAPEFIQAAAMDPEATSAATGKLTDAVEKSLNQKAVDALLGASNVIRQAKDAGQSVEEFVQQSGLFGDIDPDVAAMAVFIAKNNRSAKRMGEAFKAMATFIKGELQRRQTADMFGDGEPVDFKDIVAAANRELERMYGPGVETIGLFDRPADPPAADPAQDAPPEPKDIDLATAMQMAADAARAAGIELSEWRASSANGWSYATATIGDRSVSIGASTGGIVSINGDPFTPVGRKPNDNPAAVAESMQALVARMTPAPMPLEADGDDLSTPDGRYLAGERAFQRGVQEGIRPRMIGLDDWIRGYEDARIASANAAEPDPIAIVDAAYRFDDATEEFKDYLYESVGETMNSPFDTARQIDGAVKSHGGKVSWAMVEGAVLDSADDEEWPCDIGDDDDVLVLDGDFPGHPFRGNQFKRARMDSHHAGRASREARRADRTAKGHDRVLNYVHNAAAHAHKRAAKGAKGKALAYHSKMATFHAKRAKHHADKLEGKMVLDSVTDEAWPDDGIAVFDYTGNGTAQGLIRKGREILGRAVVDDNGNAMIYTGKSGADRVLLGDDTPAQWGHPVAFMVNALFGRASAAKRKKKEPMKEDTAPAAAPAPEAQTTPAEPASDPARTADIAYMRAIIAGTSPDMLEPDTADRLIAIMERHGDDAEVQDLAGQAIDAYQAAAMEATAGIR